MDAIVKPWPKGSNPPLSDHVSKAPEPVSPRPSRAEAEAAVRTLIAYIGPFAPTPAFMSANAFVRPAAERG